MKLLFLIILGLIFNEFLCENLLEKNEEVLSREKRVSNDEIGNLRSGAAVAGNNPFPIVLPPYNNSQPQPNWGSCLLYMEDITIVALTPNAPKSGGQQAVYAHIRNNDNSTWGGDMNCVIKNTTESSNNATYITFDIGITLKQPVNALMGGLTTSAGSGEIGYSLTGTLEFTLYFRIHSLDVWYLEFVDLKAITIKGNTFIKNDYDIAQFKQNITIPGYTTEGQVARATDANIRGSYGYSYGCSATPAVFFTAGEDATKIVIGLVLNNFQVEAYNIYKSNNTQGPPIVQFKTWVNDCVPTFSIGSWMSIIASLVLAAVFIFGFLMLNSIQTMDRFDDPKAKQIIINTKE